MEMLYAFAFFVLNLFGCFGLPSWAVDVILERAQIIIPLHADEPRKPGPPIGVGRQTFTTPKTGEARVYGESRLTVGYNKNGRAVWVSRNQRPR